MSYEPNDWSCGDIVTTAQLNAMERGIADMNSEYVPNEWEHGDVITAEKLNHMEQGIANGGACWDVLTDESVTTVAVGQVNEGNLSYRFTSEPPSTLRITFDGTAYECNATPLGGAVVYVYGEVDAQTGEPIFTNYPFALGVALDGVVILTETAGTHAIKLEARCGEVPSDLRLATMTVNNNVSTDFNWTVPNAVQGCAMADILVQTGHHAFDVIIFQGECLLHTFITNPDVRISTSGNIRAEEDTNDFVIWGDCTITVDSDR